MGARTRIGVFVECDDQKDADDTLERLTEGQGFVAEIITVSD